MDNLVSRKSKVFYKNLQLVSGKPVLEILLLFLSDLAGFAVAIGIVTIFRYLLLPQYGDNILDPQVVRTILNVLLMSTVMLAARGLYPGWGRSSVAELKQIIEAISMAYVLTGVIIFIQGALIDFSRSAFILSWFFAIITLPVGRFLVRKYIARFAWWGEPVVIIGLEKEIKEVILRLTGCPRLGLRPVVGLAVDSQKRDTLNRCQILPWSQELQKELQYKGIHTNILAISTNQLRRDYPHVFSHIELSFRKTVFILDNDIFSIMMAQPVDISGQPAIISRQSLLDPTTRFAKQLTEFLMILVISIPFTLLGLVIAILIKLDSPGPVFYYHERVGQNRRRLRVFKFRTMVKDADKVLKKMLRDPEVRREWETYHKITNDLRITRVGKWLRHFSLDELPQFINVLRGEMALIGPRPLVKAEIDQIGEPASVILHVHPGITGWWQVMGRNNLTFEERTRLDLYYVYNWSLWLDLFIFIKTFWTVLVERNEG